MLGHSKTVLVLMGGFLFLGEHAGPRKLAGMAMAVTGMVLYGRASMAGAKVPAPLPSSRAASSSGSLAGGGGAAGAAAEAGEAGEKALLLPGKAVAVAANGSGGDGDK